MPPVVDIPRARKRVLQKDVKLVEFAHRRWATSLQEGQTLEDAITPEFWADIVRNDGRGMVAGDVIEIRSFDHSLFAELYARKVEQGAAFMALIRAADFVDRAAEAKASKHDDVLTSRWNVGKRTFDVIRSSDRQIVSSGHKLKEDAQAWIEDHLKALKAA